MGKRDIDESIKNLRFTLISKIGNAIVKNKKPRSSVFKMHLVKPIKVTPKNFFSQLAATGDCLAISLEGIEVEGKIIEFKQLSTDDLLLIYSHICAKGSVKRFGN